MLSVSEEDEVALGNDALLHLAEILAQNRMFRVKLMNGNGYLYD